MSELDKVEELRDELRHKRTTGSPEDGGSLDGNTGGPDRATGPGYQGVRREGGANNDAYRSTSRSGGGFGEVSLGVGQADRRPGSDNSSIYDGTATPTRRSRRTTGRIEADDDIPIRTGNSMDIEYNAPIKKRGRKPRSTIPIAEVESLGPIKKRSVFRVKTLPFSAAEAEAKREPLASALTDIFKYTDEYLWWVAEDELKQPVWSDVDDEEMEKLLGALLGQAQESAVGAAVVNNIILASNYIALGGITIPRLARTLKLLGTAQIKRKQKRQLEVVK